MCFEAFSTAKKENKKKEKKAFQARGNTTGKTKPLRSLTLEDFVRPLKLSVFTAPDFVANVSFRFTACFVYFPCTCISVKIDHKWCGKLFLHSLVLFSSASVWERGENQLRCSSLTLQTPSHRNVQEVCLPWRPCSKKAPKIRARNFMLLKIAKRAGF